MSNNTKASSRKTVVDILKELQLAEKKKAGIERQNGTGISGSGARPIGTADSGPPTDNISSEFLKRSGDVSIGPVALNPQLQTISGGTIDLSPATGNFTPRLIIVSETGTSDDIDTILNASNSGQPLNIQIVATHTITLKHLTGNFRSGTGADIVMGSQSNIWLIFDSIASQWTNIGLPSDSASGGAGGANTSLSNLIITSINQSLIPNANIAHDLGSALASWDTLWVEQIKFDDDATAPVSGDPHIILTSVTGMHFNVELTTDLYRWHADGESLATLSRIGASQGEFTVFSINPSKMIFFDTSTQPTTNGEFRRDGADVFVFSGGAVRNLTDIGTGASGANQQLSNLVGTVAINLSLNPNAAGTLDIGSDINFWDSVKAQAIRFRGSLSSPSGSTGTRISVDAAGDMEFNVPGASNRYDLYFNGVNEWGFSDDLLSGKNIILTEQFTINDSSTQPASNGAFRNDGGDVYVFSGGSVRNLSDIGVAAGGANVNLSNLGITSINSDLLPQAGKKLGDSGNIWSSATVNKYVIETAGTILAAEVSITNSGGDLTTNVDTGDLIDFKYGNVSKWTLSQSTLIGSNIILSNTITINDSSIQPVVNGQFSRDGNDLYVFSGGAVRNLSDIGSGGGANTALSNLISTSINQSLIPNTNGVRDLGSSGLQWRNLWITGKSELDDVDIDGAFFATGTSTFQGIVSLSGSTTSITSSTILIGDSSSDNIFMFGRVDTDIIPDNDDTYDLGSNSLRWDNVYIVTLDVESRVRSNSTASEMGFFVSDYTGSVGTEGSMELPVLSGSSGTKAAADADFGAIAGASGWINISGTPILIVRSASGSWYGIGTGLIFP